MNLAESASTQNPPGAEEAASRAAGELFAIPLARLQKRSSAKWAGRRPDVIAMGLAEMDIDLAPTVIEAIQSALERSDVGYASPGSAFADAVASFGYERWGWQLDPTAVRAIPDVGVGVVELLRILAPRGARVAITPPVYAPFTTWIEEAGAVVHAVPLHHRDGRWALDLPALEKAFQDGVKVFLLCSPHNPVGHVFSASELDDLVGLAGMYDVIVLSDEIHGPLVLPGTRFTPLLSVPGAGAVAIVLASASKAFNIAGLKCAYIVTGSRRIAAVIARLPEDIGWRVGQLGLLASTAALRDGNAWLDAVLLELSARRSQLSDLLTHHLPDLRWNPPEATYFAWIDFSPILPTGAAAAERILKQCDVELEPGQRFAPNARSWARMNFATSEEMLTTAVGRITERLQRA